MDGVDYPPSVDAYPYDDALLRVDLHLPGLPQSSC